MQVRWSDNDSDEALVEASLKDPEAFGPFYRRYAVTVHRFFATRISDPAVAADLTAEVFTTAVEA